MTAPRRIYIAVYAAQNTYLIASSREKEGERVSGTCEKITKSCHSERSEESAFVCFQKDKSRFFASLRMTDDFFTASRYALPGRHGFLTVFSNPNCATALLTLPSDPYGLLLFIAWRIFSTSSLGCERLSHSRYSPSSGTTVKRLPDTLSTPFPIGGRGGDWGSEI